MRESKHFINGEFVESSSGETISNLSPITGEQIGIVHDGGEQEVDMAVQAASWAARPS